MLEKIVVGYAQDRAGRDAVTLAAVLATATQGALTVVFPYHPLLAQRDAEAVQRQIAKDVRDTIEAATGGSALPEPTFHWSSSPWPIHALHEMAEYEDAGLIVLGKAREGLADHLHVSLMERLVHGAPCAVAVAPDGYSGPHELRDIGVGFSTSYEGRCAVQAACELARLTGAHVHVIAGAGLEPALASYAFSSPALVEVEDEIYEQTEENLDRFCAELPQGTAVERETLRGDPAEVLLARSEQLDLLVLGSRAYGPLRHVLLGSVSARVMRQARCPVLVMPRGTVSSHEPGHEQPHAAAREG